MKELIPKIKIIGVDHYSSTLSGKPYQKSSALLEGCGKKEKTPHADFANVDEWILVSDLESFASAKKLCQ